MCYCGFTSRALPLDFWTVDECGRKMSQPQEECASGSLSTTLEVCSAASRAVSATPGSPGPSLSRCDAMFRTASQRAEVIDVDAEDDGERDHANLSDVPHVTSVPSDVSADEVKLMLVQRFTDAAANGAAWTRVESQSSPEPKDPAPAPQVVSECRGCGAQRVVHHLA